MKHMRVLKRNCEYEDVHFDKVLRRIQNLSDGLEVDVYDIAQKIISRIYDGVKTSELDELAAHICSSLIVEHPDYGALASRIIISNHHKNTSPSFSEAITLMWNNRDDEGAPCPLVSEQLYKVVMANKEKLNSYIDYNRDYNFDYFGFKTLERSYLVRINGVIVERPQHMLMRVALGIHGGDVKDALQTYDLMSTKHFVHATPTLFNAGTPRPQCSSCFLLGMEDSIEGIFDTIKECAQISKYAGGIGMWIHDIRARNSRIRGTNGYSTGIVPMLKVINNVARHINQGSKRNGSIAVYLEPWHADVEQFLEMKLPQGAEEERARDLFYALWVPDLFMKRVRENGVWSLMCPDQSRGLSDVWGDRFEELYEKYEREGKFVKQVKAQDIWFKILQSQIESGVPYICYKDAANRKSNQQNLGTIKSSNLCVAGDTQILTDQGYVEIKSVAGQYVNVWNGEEFSRSLVAQTGVGEKLITVKFSNGANIRCTPYHKFVMEGHNEFLEAKDLEVGMTVKEFKLPRPDTDNKPENVFIYNKNISIVAIINNDEKEDTYCFNEPKRHLGVFNGILTGNCSEIVEYSDSHESSVCNLSSICLPTYVKFNKENNSPYFDFEKMHEVVKVSTKNLNKVIDINFYPHPKTRRSNLRHRPIGIGVQGLADTFVLMKMPFDSPEARELNRLIFETIYHAAVEQSMEIAKKRHLALADNSADYNLNWNEFEQDLIGSKYPGAYSTFEGSPASQGQLQFDLWGVSPTPGRYDWDTLKADIVKYGMRNSLLLAPMPTASTSQIMGFNECFEPFTSNIYKRKTLAGEFILVNKYLIKDLAAIGLWNKEMKNKIIMADGSIQGITEIPQEIRDLYKIVWEIKQKVLIDMAADRGAYICQSQSLNLFVEDPTFQKLSSMHFYGWNAGLKTGIYYLRTRPKAMAQKVTMEPVSVGGAVATKKVVETEEEGCVMCSA